MAEYISVKQARGMSGLRLVVTAHVPGLWSEALKNIFDAKHFPYVLVEQVVGGENRDLQEWTAQASAPVAIWNDERPRTTWTEQLYLAERLAPQPALIPADLEDRLLMFGLCNEICSENGYGWNLRARHVYRSLTDGKAGDDLRQVTKVLAVRYAYDPDQVQAGQQQMTALVGRLRTQLEEQRTRGRRFLVGETLTALDLYWAAFAMSIEALPPALCPTLPAEIRAGYFDPELKEVAGAALMAHRDAVYRDFLKLPMDF
jgi:glutathione S-transferase